MLLLERLCWCLGLRILIILRLDIETEISDSPCRNELLDVPRDKLYITLNTAADSTLPAASAWTIDNNCETRNYCHARTRFLCWFLLIHSIGVCHPPVVACITLMGHRLALVRHEHTSFPLDQSIRLKTRGMKRGSYHHLCSLSRSRGKHELKNIIMRHDKDWQSRSAQETRKYTATSAIQVDASVDVSYGGGLPVVSPPSVDLP